MISPNDWDTKRLLALAGIWIVASFTLLSLDLLNFHIPLLRATAFFVLLTFIPGILLLRILKIHGINYVEALLYAVGLSLIFDMCIGLAANFIPLLFGLDRPLNLLNLTVALIFAITVLFGITWFRDREFKPVVTAGTRKLPPGGLIPYFIAFLLPCLAILGTSAINQWQNNISEFIFIFSFIGLLTLGAFNRFFRPEHYPLIIFMSAVSLLFSTTLISSNLVGSDIHLEYCMSQLAAADHFWDPSVRLTVNTCLSLVMLAPVYSFLTGLDMVWVFKVVYPVLFSFMPLVLYRIFRLQMGARVAFLSAIFFVSLPMFSMDLAQLARQQVAELFLSLLILLMVERRLSRLSKILLTVVFGIGAIVSHYGLGIALIGYLAATTALIFLLKSQPVIRFWGFICGGKDKLPANLQSPVTYSYLSLLGIIGVLIFFSAVYFIFTASGAVLTGHGSISYAVTTQQVPPDVTVPTLEQSTLPPPIQAVINFLPFLDPLTKEPLTRTALGIDFFNSSTWGQVWRIFQFIVQACLLAGLLIMLLRPARLGNKLRTEYIALVIASFIILACVFAVPRGFGFGSVRIWHITLLFTAPLFIAGGSIIISGIISFFNRPARSISRFSIDGIPLTLTVLLILLPYYILNSGVVFELSKNQSTESIDVPYSIALSNYRTDVSTAYLPQDMAAADWIFTFGSTDNYIFTDYTGEKVFMQRGLYNVERLQRITGDVIDLRYPNYTYLRSWNVTQEVITTASGYASRKLMSFDSITGFRQKLVTSDTVYETGLSRVVVMNSR